MAINNDYGQPDSVHPPANALGFNILMDIYTAIQELTRGDPEAQGQLCNLFENVQRESCKHNNADCNGPCEPHRHTRLFIKKFIAHVQDITKWQLRQADREEQSFPVNGTGSVVTHNTSGVEPPLSRLRIATEVNALLEHYTVSYLDKRDYDLAATSQSDAVSSFAVLDHKDNYNSINDAPFPSPSENDQLFFLQDKDYNHMQNTPGSDHDSIINNDQNHIKLPTTNDDTPSRGHINNITFPGGADTVLPMAAAQSGYDLMTDISTGRVDNALSQASLNASSPHKGHALTAQYAKVLTTPIDNITSTLNSDMSTYETDALPNYTLTANLPARRDSFMSLHGNNPDDDMEAHLPVLTADGDALEVDYKDEADSDDDTEFIIRGAPWSPVFEGEGDEFDFEHGEDGDGKNENGKDKDGKDEGAEINRPGCLLPIAFSVSARSNGHRSCAEDQEFKIAGGYHGLAASEDMVGNAERHPASFGNGAHAARTDLTAATLPIPTDAATPSTTSTEDSLDFHPNVATAPVPNDVCDKSVGKSKDNNSISTSDEHDEA